MTETETYRDAAASLANLAAVRAASRADAGPSSAADLLAARRARRAGDVATMRAGRDLARMSAAIGEDAFGAAAVSALDGADGATREDVGRLVASAWSQAREARQRGGRSDAAREDRERTYWTGRDAVREERADLAARVAGQFAVYAAPECAAIADGPACSSAPSVHLPAANVEDVEDVRYFLAAARHLPAASVGCRYCAVVAAIAADGPTQRPDHDAAGCAVPACRKCAHVRRRAASVVPAPDVLPNGPAVRTVEDVERGPLSRPARKRGKRARRPARADLAPRERTSERRVSILREASLPNLLDRTAAFGRHADAGNHSWESSEPADPRADSAMVAADLAIVETVGRRGVAVAWTDAAVRYGADRDAWRVEVCGRVAAFGIERGYLDAGNLRKLARSANVAAADLAAAMTDALDGPDHDAAAIAYRDRSPRVTEYRRDVLAAIRSGAIERPARPPMTSLSLSVRRG